MFDLHIFAFILAVRHPQYIISWARTHANWQIFATDTITILIGALYYFFYSCDNLDFLFEAINKPAYTAAHTMSDEAASTISLTIPAPTTAK